MQKCLQTSNIFPLEDGSTEWLEWSFTNKNISLDSKSILEKSRTIMLKTEY